MGNFNIEDLDDDVIDALILKGGREKATISRENNIYIKTSAGKVQFFLIQHFETGF